MYNVAEFANRIRNGTSEFVVEQRAASSGRVDQCQAKARTTVNDVQMNDLCEVEYTRGNGASQLIVLKVSEHTYCVSVR
jgi:hypothetical protein